MRILTVNSWVERRKSSSKVKQAILACSLLLSFGIFKLFPGMNIINAVWLVILVTLFLLSYLPYKSIGRRHFNVMELYVIGMIVVAPVYVALMGQLRFGQPLTYGALSLRWILNGAVAIYVFIGLRSGRLILHDIERVLVICAWLTFAIYMSMYLFLNPENFTSYTGFVSGSGTGVYAFRLDNTLLVLAFFYYGFKGYRRRSLRNYLVAAVFLVYLIFVSGGRSQILAALSSFTFLTVRWGSGGRRFEYVPKALLGVIGAVLLLFAVAPTYMQGLSSRMDDAINVVVVGQQGEDASANARILESAIADPYISHHWLLGNGSISNQWHGGYEGVLGGYFYPSDIGILGVIFVCGLLGTVMFALPLWWTFRTGRKMARRAIYTPLTDALFGYILYMAVRSFVTGELVWSASVCWTFAIIICYAAEYYMLTMTNKDDIR